MQTARAIMPRMGPAVRPTGATAPHGSVAITITISPHAAVVVTPVFVNGMSHVCPPPTESAVSPTSSADHGQRRWQRHAPLWWPACCAVLCCIRGPRVHTHMHARTHSLAAGNVHSSSTTSACTLGPCTTSCCLLFYRSVCWGRPGMEGGGRMLHACKRPWHAARTAWRGARAAIRRSM